MEVRETSAFVVDVAYTAKCLENARRTSIFATAVLCSRIIVLV